MQSAAFIGTILPIFLVFVMVGIGMSLTTGDFRRVFVEPKAVLVGIAGQLVALPAIAFLLGLVLHLPPALAVGLVLLAACPGGPVSNLFTYIAKGDAALSVSLTAFSNFTAALTLPLVTGWALAIHYPHADAPSLPFLATAARVVLLTVAPVLVGLSVRRWAPSVADRLEPVLNQLATAGVVVLVAYVFYREREHLLDLLSASGGAVALFLALTILVALLLGTGLRLARPQRITIIFELGFQNAVLGFTIALTVMGSAEIAIPLALYTLMSATILTVVLIWMRVSDRWMQEEGR